MHTIQTTLTKIGILTAIVMVALAVNYLQAAWNPPSANPPASNTDAPVNIGGVDQVKNAGLSVDALAVFGNQYVQDNLGIGTPSPARTLDVVGSSQIVATMKGTQQSMLEFQGGTSGAGYVGAYTTGGLVLSGTTYNSNNVMIDPTGDVGIGDITPDGTLKLDVEGQIGATAYCDQNGNNCITPGAAGGNTGRLYWDGGWFSNNFWCDAGYTLVQYHSNCGCSNNATWYACVR